MNSLKHFIKTRYGSNSELARHLDISPQAVGSWVTKPRNALRFMPEICVQVNVTPQYLLNVVMNTEAELLQTNGGTTEYPTPTMPDDE